MQCLAALEHRAEKWTRFSDPHDALNPRRKHRIRSKKCKSTFGSDALGERCIHDADDAGGREFDLGRPIEFLRQASLDQPRSETPPRRRLDRGASAFLPLEMQPRPA